MAYTTPATAVAGSVLTAAWLNTYVRDNVAALYAGATAGQIVFPAAQNASSGANTLDDYEEGTYTPTWSSAGVAPSVGNGTITGHYVKVGQLVWVTVRLVMGSTTTFGNNAAAWTFSLPFTANASVGATGAGVGTDAGVANYPLVASIAPGGSTVQLLKTTTAVGSNVTTDDPFVWANGDVLTFTLVYRADA